MPTTEQDGQLQPAGNALPTTLPAGFEHHFHVEDWPSRLGGTASACCVRIDNTDGLSSGAIVVVDQSADGDAKITLGLTPTEKTGHSDNTLSELGDAVGSCVTVNMGAAGSFFGINDLGWSSNSFRIVGEYDSRDESGWDGHSLEDLAEHIRTTSRDYPELTTAVVQVLKAMNAQLISTQPRLQQPAQDPSDPFGELQVPADS